MVNSRFIFKSNQEELRKCSHNLDTSWTTRCKGLGTNTLKYILHKHIHTWWAHIWLTKLNPSSCQPNSKILFKTDPSPRELPYSGIEPESFISPALSDKLYSTSVTQKAPSWPYHEIKILLSVHWVNFLAYKYNRWWYVVNSVESLRKTPDVEFLFLIFWNKGYGGGGGGLVTQSCLTFAAPGSVAQQIPLFMGFPKQEYWSE